MQMIMPYRHRRRPYSLGFSADALMPRGMHKFDAASIMKTDISQTEEGYHLSMVLPGFSKEDVQLELKDGYLVVSAEMSSQTEEAPQAQAEEAVPAQDQAEGSGQEEKSSEAAQTWVRRERFFGSCQRSFYMGEDIDEEHISAKFENGLLNVTVPKLAVEEAPEQKKLIEIQG